jgi:hypothetical protein
MFAEFNPRKRSNFRKNFAVFESGIEQTIIS